MRDGRNSRMESKTGRREQDLGKQPGKKAIRLHSEKQACPRKRNPTAVKAVLRRRQPEREGKAFWDAEQFDCHPSSSFGTRIASQSLFPRETRVRSLRTGQDHARCAWHSGGRWRQTHLDTLVSHELHAGAPVRSAAPISRSRTGAEPTRSGCEPHTHLARLRGRAAIPLTLLA